jgi:hypothetical protein
MRSHSTHVRDNSLRRLSRINRWLVAGSVALTGFFAEAAAHAFSGKASTKPKPAAKHDQLHSRRHRHTSAGQSALSPKALRPPQQAPQATTDTAPESEPAPAQESAPAPAPAQETAPEPEIADESASEPAPQQESAPPVVSGGS